ncbi:right-handed parallel beta-helix repeat-containing protein [Haloferax mucosum]|uniref:right-handed parallel beta-helix repeat-containing protein n=1 Tax=Haloferax mucosum TaxID=403181 RepID=UPI0009FC64FC|nr:right-handed parallel beta-helix repeat-containing protein [Haloferax mucosum]
MTNTLEFLRREVLELTGSAFVGGGTGRREPNQVGETTGSQAEDATVEETFRGSLVQTDHLLTESRNVDVVIWKDDDGTIHADGGDEVIASDDDFSTVVQSAVATGVSKLAIDDGHYVATEQIELDSGTIVEGMGTQTTIEVAGNVAFSVSGERGYETRITADLEEGDDSVSVVDASQFDEGQLVLITSDRTTAYRNQPYGEIHQLSAVDGESDRLRVSEGGLLDFYRTSDDAVVHGLDAVSDVVVRDMEFIGSDQNAYRSGVTATYANRVFVENCKMHDLGYAGVAYISTVFSAVSNCEMYDIGYDGGGVGYGVSLVDAVRNIHVRNSVFHQLRNHGTTVGGNREDGLPRLITFQSNEYYRNDADVHVGGVVQFDGNRFVNANGSIISGAESTIVRDCEFRGLSSDAIKNRGDPEMLVVDGCHFRKIAGRGIDFYDNISTIDSLTISGCDFSNVDSNVFRFRIPDGHVVDNITITGNEMRSCGTNAVIIEELGASEITDLEFSNNRIDDVAGVALLASEVSGTVRVLGNAVSNTDGSYVVAVGGRRNLVSNNDFRTFTDRGLLVRGGGLVTGNTVVNGDNDAVLVYRTAGVVVAQNQFVNTSGADINEIDSTDCKFVGNDLASGLDSDGESNVVRENFGYQTAVSGTYTTSGDGTVRFEIPHELDGNAELAHVWAESADAAGAFYVSDKGADTVSVTYDSPPPRGSNNVTWGYEFKTYTD